MRRLLFTLLATSFVGTMVGCGHFHSHGICDCEYDDHCASRAPWVHGGASEPGIVTPDIREPLPLPSKKY